MKVHIKIIILTALFLAGIAITANAATNVSSSYQINWDGLDELGKSVVSGIYLYRMQTQNFSQMKRMILLR